MWWLLLLSCLLRLGGSWVQKPFKRQTLGDLLVQKLSRRRENSIVLPEPADPAANPSDDIFREMRQQAPTSLQYFVRDSGLLRGLMDSAVLLGVEPIVKENPSALVDLLKLTGRKSLIPFLPESFRNETKLTVEVDHQKLAYGGSNRQFVSLLQPQGDASKTDNNGNVNSDRLVLFVHGGAWGSGFPSMYQLIATPFLNKGFSVGLVGYRTYPTANVTGQIDDISRAVKTCRDYLPKTKEVTLMGHSTGAHISALAFLKEQISPSEVGRFIGLAGVFDLPDHYKFEQGRGLDRLSPLAPACGQPNNRLNGWKLHSPSRFTSVEEKLPRHRLILHGAEDTVVPYTSSEKFVYQMNNNGDLRILPDVEHAEMILHLMFGGTTTDNIMEWMT